MTILVNDNFDNMVLHRINKTEIDFGILSIRVKDGTRNILTLLPEYFSIVINGKEIKNRRLMTKSVWIGFDIMGQFKLNQQVTITRKNDVIYID